MIATVDFTLFEQMLVESIIPNGDSVIAIGSPGIGKSKRHTYLMRRLQAANPDFGSCMDNIGGAELMRLFGTPKNSDNRFSATGIPPWMMPNETEGLRGVFRKLYDPTAHDLKIQLNNTTALDPYPEGVACLDECWGSPDQGVRMALPDFWAEGKLGDWQLPPGWAKVGYTNSTEHRSGVKPPPMMSRNRVLELYIEPSVMDQINYWKSVGFREEFTLFAMYHPDLIINVKVPAQDEQWGTCRAWDKAENGALTWMKNHLGMDPDNDPLPVTDKGFLAFIEGRVGHGVLSSFLTFLTDMTAIPSYQEIIASPAGVKIPADPLKQKMMANVMSYTAEFNDLQLLIECARRMDKPIAGIFYADVAKRFGSSLARQTWFLSFGDWCGHGAKLQANRV